MKKRNILLTTAFVGALSLGGCGKAELKPLAEQIEVELASSLDENVTAYVALDEKAAKEATLDLSAVDTNKTGTYKASVTYKEQTAAFEVVVKDTTAPEVALVDKVTVAAGMPLHAKDVIAEVTELSGEVTAVFENAEPEMAKQTEATETLEVAATEMPETEAAAEVVQSKEETETFMVGAVTCTDDTTVFGSVGAYDVLLTVVDASGNETEVKVSVIVGEAPEFLGIEDLTVTVGTERVDYLEGVTATDYKGTDITDRIVCDAALVNLDAVGTYEILYQVTDEEGFGAEEKASVVVAEKKAAKSGGKKSPEKNQTNAGNTSNPGGTANPGNGGNAGSTANTGNTGTPSQPSGNAGASSAGGNTGNAGALSNGGNGSNATTPSQPSGNAGTSGNNGNVATPSQPNGNIGSTDQNAGNAGNTGNVGGTDQNAGNTDNPGNNGSTDNSGSTDAGNNSNTTPPAGSVTDPNTGMSVPGDIEIEDWGNMQGGADDGTGLGGGSSVWH